MTFLLPQSSCFFFFFFFCNLHATTNWAAAVLIAEKFSQSRGSVIRQCSSSVNPRRYVLKSSRWENYRTSPVSLKGCTVPLRYLSQFLLTSYVYKYMQIECRLLMESSHCMFRDKWAAAPCIFSIHSFAELALSAMSGTSDEELYSSHNGVLLLFFQSTLLGSCITQFYLLNGSIRAPLQSVPVDSSIFRSSLHQR